jgi:hypothetical protein
MKRIVSSLFFILLSGGVMAQQSLTLQEAVATGLEKNLNIQIV